MSKPIQIRPIATQQEAEQAEELQRQAWGMSDLEVLPAMAMHAMQHNGAIWLGAFDGDVLAGYVLGMLSTQPSQPNEPAGQVLQLYSVMMGVLPAYQNQQVGYQLKLAQRTAALQRGLDLITWTYDPLESRNAWFNFGKLGVICEIYLRDYHGELGGINAGLSTDRFYVSWPIASERVAQTVRGERPVTTLTGSGGIIINEGGIAADLPEHPTVLIQIPANIQAIKQTDMVTAKLWRGHTKYLFEHYFKAGYTVVDFIRYNEEKSYYVLSQ